jgi:hypothetical protein
MPPNKVSFDDVIAAHDALKEHKSLSGFGVEPVVWRLSGVCPRHGVVRAQVSTWGGPPDVHAVHCLPCRRDGVVRIVEVRDLDRLTGKPIPEVGKETE